MSSSMDEITAVIYGRVSTARQADDGLPVESQIEQGYTKANSLGARVAKVFRDEGISGRTSRRPAFQEAIAYAIDRRITYFIVWSSSRFARNRVDAASYKTMLKRAGVKLVYVSCDIDLDSEDNWLADVMFEVMDEHYSRTIAKDTRRSMMKNARDGYFNGGRVPFGYKTVDAGKRKRLEPVEHEAMVVGQVFRLCLEGNGAKETALRLNAQCLFKRGKPWDKAAVSAVLKNPVYTGSLVFNRRTHADRIVQPESDWVRAKGHEAIISDEVFARTQEIIGKRAPVINGGSAKSRFVFSGLLRCGRCDSAMQIETATGRSSSYSYYNCRSALKGCGCENRRIPASDLDDWMMGAILDRVFTPERIRECLRDLHEINNDFEKDRQAKMDVLASEEKMLKRKLETMFEILETYGVDTPNLGDLTGRLRQHKNRLAEIEREAAEVSNQAGPSIDIDESEVEEAGRMFREIVTTTRDPARLRGFFGGIIKRIVLNDEHVFIEYAPERLVNRTGFDAVHSTKNGWLPDLGSNQGPAD